MSLPENIRDHVTASWRVLEASCCQLHKVFPPPLILRLSQDHTDQSFQPWLCQLLLVLGWAAFGLMGPQPLEAHPGRQLRLSPDISLGRHWLGATAFVSNGNWGLSQVSSLKSWWAGGQERMHTLEIALKCNDEIQLPEKLQQWWPDPLYMCPLPLPVYCEMLWKPYYLYKNSGRQYCF